MAIAQTESECPANVNPKEAVFQGIDTDWFKEEDISLVAGETSQPQALINAKTITEEVVKMLNM
jgi:hypothetical protein